MLTPEIKNALQKSVLCWLATCSSDGMPNVSPKELFLAYDDTTVLVANIASPQTEKNLLENANACLSFVDIWTQKGFQLKGKIIISRKGTAEYKAYEAPLQKITQGKFPIRSIFVMSVESAKPIVAPSYWLFPDTTEAQQIENAKQTYLNQIER